MWTPKYIHIKNLFAHVDTKYQFKPGVCTVIFGENHDDDDSENNGAGKSTLFEGIAIALTGKSLRDIDKEVFINRHSDECEVEMLLENNAMNSTLGIIRRFYRGGKSTKVEVYENGERNAQLVSVNEANARIIDLIGISRDDLLRYFIISQDNKYQFFTAGDVEKKEVLNRITNADMMNPIIDKLQADKKELEGSIRELQYKIDKCEGKLDLLKEQKEEALAENDTDEKVGELDKKIKLNQIKVSGSESNIVGLEGELKRIDKKVAELVDVDTSELEEKRDKLRNKIQELEKQESEAGHIIQHLKVGLSGAVKCPECGSEFIPESDYDMNVDEMRETIKETEKVLEDVRDKIAKRRSKLLACVESIREAERVEGERSKLESKRKKTKREIEDEKSNILYYKKSIERIKREIEDLKKSDSRVKVVKELEKKIKETESQLKSLNEEMEGLNDNMSMIDYWIYYMGKNGFKTYLANRAVKIIEGICNSFLKRFHSSMTVEINGFKINKSGEVREKIDVLAVYRGLYAQNFMGYSGGERGRIYLASILGIQHLINLSSGGKGIDLMILDESLGALDSRGVVNICNILNELGVTVLMITQNVSKDVNISNKVLVVREDEISRIIE